MKWVRAYIKQFTKKVIANEDPLPNPIIQEIKIKMNSPYFLPIRLGKLFKVSVRVYKNWRFHAELMEVYFALLWRANSLKSKTKNEGPTSHSLLYRNAFMHKMTCCDEQPYNVYKQPSIHQQEMKRNEITAMYQYTLYSE